MGKRFRFFTAFLLIACLGATLYFTSKEALFGFAVSPGSAEAAALPKIRDFELTGLDSRKTKLSAEVKRNKVTVLNFFATWCPPCRAETPEFVRFHKRYGGKGVEIVAVDLGEDVKTVREFAAEYGMTYPVLLDKSGKVSDMYEVYSIPSTFVINGKGQIVESFLGSIRESTLEKSVNAILK